MGPNSLVVVYVDPLRAKLHDMSSASNPRHSRLFRGLGLRGLGTRDLSLVGGKMNIIPKYT